MTLFDKLLKPLMTKYIEENILACRQGTMSKEAFVSFYVKYRNIKPEDITPIYDDIMNQNKTDADIIQEIVNLSTVAILHIIKK